MRKSRCKRNNGSKMEGGNLGAGWGFSPSTQDQIMQNPIVATPIGNCRAPVPATLRPGFMPDGYTGSKGLPGMQGGKRRKSSRKHKKGKKHSRKQYKMNQAGGRYGFDISNAPPGGTPWGTSYAPISSIPCEASRQTIPDSGAANTLNKVGSELWDGPIPAKGVLAGGGANPAPITWANNDAASGSPSLMVPTARYTVNSEPPIITAAGTNLSINTPINYPQMNPACLKTGGSRKMKKSRKSSKKSKKSKKHHRKH
jgi:hypothetical protein